MNRNIIVTFLGPDGSGKTTLINTIAADLKKKKIFCKYLHLRPNLFKAKYKIVKDPHNQILRSKFLSLSKLVYWLILFKIYFFFNKKTFFLFDRYPYDLLIDPVRYRFNLNKNITKIFLRLFPKPKMIIVLNISHRIILRRKREVKKSYLITLIKKYSKLNKEFNEVIYYKNNQDYLNIFKKIYKLKNE